MLYHKGPYLASASLCEAPGPISLETDLINCVFSCLVLPGSSSCEDRVCPPNKNTNFGDFIKWSQVWLQTLSSKW